LLAAIIHGQDPTGIASRGTNGASDACGGIQQAETDPNASLRERFALPMPCATRSNTIIQYDQMLSETLNQRVLVD